VNGNLASVLASSGFSLWEEFVYFSFFCIAFFKLESSNCRFEIMCDLLPFDSAE
jgi:hypothetical protein